MVSRKYLILVAMVGTLVSFDQLTKLLVTESFHLSESRPVIEGFLNLTLVHNRGAAFGILGNLKPSLRDPILFLLPALVLAIILYTFTRLRESQLLNIYALSLITGGAIGNFVDRLRLGWVVDFLDFHWQQKAHFPAFNLADSAITIGVGMLFISILFEKEPPAEETAEG